MSGILANTPTSCQAKGCKKNKNELKIGTVEVTALFRPNTWSEILEASKLSGINFQGTTVCPRKFWRTGLRYHLAVTLDNNDARSPKYSRIIKVRATHPHTTFQPIGKWKQANPEYDLAQNTSSRRNQQLNVLLVDAAELVNVQSSLTVFDFESIPEDAKKSLEANWPKYTGARQLVRFSSPLKLERLFSTPKLLNQFRQGQHNLFDALLELPVPPSKLLDMVLQTGCPKLFKKLVAAGRLPPINWAQMPHLKGQLHLLGMLPVESKIMFFLARRQNLRGLEEQIRQGIPWSALTSDAPMYYQHDAALNFLGYNLPCPNIEFRPSPDARVRQDLARCAYQYSAGFNLLSPTVTAILQAGAGLEECLNLCRTRQGTALKKLVLSRFDSLRQHFTQQDPATWRLELSKDPWLTKLAQLPSPSKAAASIQEIELF